MSNEPTRPADSVGRGVLLALLAHLVGQLLIWVAVWGYGELTGRSNDSYFSITYIVSVAFIGVTQLPYAIPIAIVLGRRGRKQTLKGFLIVAGVLMLINGACTIAISVG